MEGGKGEVAFKGGEAAAADGFWAEAGEVGVDGPKRGVVAEEELAT